MLDLEVINGTVVSAEGQARLDVGVDGGRVVLLAAPGSLPAAAETIDATGLLVLPGTIDSHFHCRAPSFPEREDFASGTRAAAAGGVTTVLEMPISVPPTTDGTTLAARRAHAQRDAYVDVGFYSSSATLDRDRIGSAVAEGAVALKAFLQEVPAGRESEFDGLCIHRNDEILRALELVTETGLPAVFHAEDYPTYSLLERRLRDAGRHDPPAHGEGRPDYVEALAIGNLILLAAATGARLHIPHVSSALAVDVIRDGKRRGVSVTAETCPQYLALTAAALQEHGPYAKCNPPLKSADDVAGLWEGLRDGTIDTVATDHSPFTPADKEPGWDNIWRANPGFPGVDILTPFLIGAALDGKLPLERAVTLITANPADIFGLAPRKGRLIPGADADLVLYDPTVRDTVDTASWQTRAQSSGRVWQGYPLTGRVLTTMVRGTIVYDRGEIVGSPGYGAIVRPTKTSVTPVALDQSAIHVVAS
jgi:allantoinase